MKLLNMKEKRALLRSLALDEDNPPSHQIIAMMMTTLYFHSSLQFYGKCQVYSLLRIIQYSGFSLINLMDKYTEIFSFL